MADMNYVSPLTSDLTDYYTKSEVDELQQGDAATYATSAEIVAGDNAVKGWVASQGYLTEHQDLTNYATISYVDNAIAAIEPSSGGMAVRVVSTLPGVGEENVLYLVFVDNEDEDNRYAEYVWVDTLNDYEMLGYGTGEGVLPDLTNYATKTYVDDAIQHAVDFYPTAASELSYDNTDSGLGSTDIQAAIDEICDNIPSAIGNEIDAFSATLAAVATSGDYEDLSNKPTIPSLTGYATQTYVNNAVSGITIPDVSEFATESFVDAGINNAINNLTGNLSTVATTGSYNDLTNKPAIPTVPANVSAFTNDAGYLTAHQDISGKANTADLATVAFSGDYDDLANKPSIPSTSGLASESYVDAAIGNLSIPTSLSDLDNDMNFVDEPMAKAAAIDEINNNVSAAGLSGSYNDLDDKPTIPSLSGYATEQWVGQQGYLTQHQDISGKANTADLAAVATSGDYDDLINKPIIPVLPTLATVATSGSYNDLSDKPTISESYIGNDGTVIPKILFGSNPFSSAFYTIVSSTDVFQEKFLAGYICKGDTTSVKRLYMDETWHDLHIEKNGDNYTVNLFSSGTIDTSSGKLVWRTGKNSYITIEVRGSNITDAQFKDVFVKLLKDNFLTYSNTTSGLTATTIQGAIDELAASIPTMPTLATVATSGDYDDLINKPTLFSGDYNDLRNKPTIPSGGGGSVGWSYDSSTGYMTFTGMSDNNL